MEPIHTDFLPILTLNAPDNARDAARRLTKSVAKLDRLIVDVEQLPGIIMRTLLAGGIAAAPMWAMSTTAGVVATTASLLVVAAMTVTLHRSSKTLHTLRHGGHTHIVLPADFHDNGLNEHLREAEANGELLDGITYENSRISDDLGGTVAQISVLRAKLGEDSGDLAVTAAFLARAIYANEKSRCCHALAGRIGETIELSEQIERQRAKLEAAVVALRQQVERDRRTKAENAMLRWEAKQEIGVAQPIAGRNEEALLEAQLELRTPQPNASRRNSQPAGRQRPRCRRRPNCPGPKPTDETAATQPMVEGMPNANTVDAHQHRDSARDKPRHLPPASLGLPRELVTFELWCPVGCCWKDVHHAEAVSEGVS